MLAEKHRKHLVRSVCLYNKEIYLGNLQIVVLVE